MTSQRQTSLFTEEKLTSSQGDSHANPTQWQESEKEKKMNAIYGPKCLDAYEKFNRHGSWAKMFSGLLIGMKGWSSKRCRLIWKLKGTQYNRMYFQLHPLTLHTEGTEFGLLPTITSSDARDMPNKLETGEIHKSKSGALTFVRNKDGMRFGASMREVVKIEGLLLTRTTREEVQDLEKFKARMEKYPNGTTMPNLATQVFNGFLPTPTVMEDRRIPNSDIQRTKKIKSNLNAHTIQEMLPTPVASDYKHGRRGNAPREGHNPMTNSLKDAMNFIEQTSKCSQLAPQFVLEMMGFPTDWTLLPFLNGEQSQSKQEGTQ
jgi:hypothetical protein